MKRSSFITLSVQPNAVYAGAGGELFCIDPSTGSIRWRNRLPGLGTGVIALGDSSNAAVFAAAIAAAAAAATAAVIATS